MTVSFARPDVADMTLRVLSRSVHPELLETIRELRLPIGKHSAILRLCRDGHAIEFRAKESAVTELAVSRLTPTPASGCAVSRRLIGYRTHTVVAGRIHYECSYQLETTDPEIYLQVHREMEADARKASLAVALPGSSNASPPCLSYLCSDLLKNGLVVHSFHTFPGNGAILRIQSLFEFV